MFSWLHLWRHWGELQLNSKSRNWLILVYANPWRGTCSTYYYLCLSSLLQMLLTNMWCHVWCLMAGMDLQFEVEEVEAFVKQPDGSVFSWCERFQCYCHLIYGIVSNFRSHSWFILLLVNKKVMTCYLTFFFDHLISIMDMTIMEWQSCIWTLLLTCLSILVLLCFEFAGKQQQVSQNP